MVTAWRVVNLQQAKIVQVECIELLADGAIKPESPAVSLLFTDLVIVYTRLICERVW